jgi:plastocyanin
LPTPTPTPATTTPPITTPAPTPTPGQSVTINLVAQGFAFDKATITVPAGASVTINFTNKDSAPHNFALYTNSSATTSIFKGQTVTASSVTYNFTAPSTPGSYFFRCDVHPTMMTGTFVVQ